MEREVELVQDEMKALIVLSCQFKEEPSKRFQKFHREYLKFSFRAVEVKVDYINQEVFTTNSKPLTKNPVRLFDLKNALADKFSYSDLEETLLGCLKTDHLHHHFYQNILLEYNNGSLDDPEFLSA